MLQVVCLLCSAAARLAQLYSVCSSHGSLIQLLHSQCNFCSLRFQSHVTSFSLFSICHLSTFQMLLIGDRFCKTTENYGLFSLQLTVIPKLYLSFDYIRLYWYGVLM